MEEPSAEVKEELDRLDEEAKGEGGGGGASSDSDIVKLIEASKEVIVEWNLSNRDGLRKAADDMVSFLSSKAANKYKRVDLPADRKQAMQRVGQIIASNRDKEDVTEIIPLIVKEFGFAQDKQQKDSKKRESIQKAVANPANGPLVAAFQELAELYYKTGNANAGSSYTKAVKALADLTFKITAKNAKELGKSGKSKVNNIGASTGKKRIGLEHVQAFEFLA
jgi:dynactin complex subunit